MHTVIPILRIFDYDKAVEFYINWLGFTINWKHQYEGVPVYMEVSKDDIVLHLSEHHGDCCPGSKVFIKCTEGVQLYHAELINKNYTYNKPGLKKAEWNAITMEVIDPFGNKLLFSEALEQV